MITYKSPIEITYGQMKSQIEGDILTVVCECGVIVDKDELIKALAYDRDQYKAGYDDAMATLKHGHWNEHRNGRWGSTWTCSECETLGCPSWKCCPVCTAFMSGEDGSK